MMTIIGRPSPPTVWRLSKQGQDGRGLIVRLYENERGRGSVTLRVGFPLDNAYRCNLLEENKAPLVVAQNTVHLKMKPYQIVTLRLVPSLEGEKMPA